MQNFRRELSEDGLKIKHEVDFSYGHSPIKTEYCTSTTELNKTYGEKKLTENTIVFSVMDS